MCLSEVEKKRKPQVRISLYLHAISDPWGWQYTPLFPLFTALTINYIDYPWVTDRHKEQFFRWYLVVLQSAPLWALSRITGGA